MRSRPWLFALAVAVTAGPALTALGTGCAAETSEEEADLSEDELATRLSVTRIGAASTYKAMSLDGGGFGQAGRSMKFLVDARNPAAKKTHFINANYKVGGKTPSFAKYHYDFARKALGIAEDGQTFNDVTYFTDDKRFYAGTIQTYELAEGQPPIYAVQLYPDDVIH